MGGRWTGSRWVIPMLVASTTVTASGCSLLNEHFSDEDRGRLGEAVTEAVLEELQGEGGGTVARIQWGPDWTAPLSGHVTYRSLLARLLYGAPVYEPSMTVTPVMGGLEVLPLVSRDVMARGIAPGVDPALGRVGPGAWYFHRSGGGFRVGLTPFTSYDPRGWSRGWGPMGWSSVLWAAPIEYAWWWYLGSRWARPVVVRR